MSRGLQSIILILLLTAAATNVAAQPQSLKTSCKVGVDAPAFGFWTWPANARVKVYVLSNDFEPEELSYLLAPLKDWDAVHEASGSGVRLEYEGSTKREETCENCLTIMRGPVFDRRSRHLTALSVYSARGNQIISHASIRIDLILTNLRALSDAVAHELGHNLGLLDCFTCKNRSTVMNQFKAVNVPKGMQAPTSCDIAQVAAAYQQLRKRVLPMPVAAKLISADEGEEPVDDDTPIVIPNLK